MILLTIILWIANPFPKKIFKTNPCSINIVNVFGREYCRTRGDVPPPQIFAGYINL